MALGSLGIPPLQVRIDGSIASRHYHPARFASPRRCRDNSFEIVSKVEHLRSCHESGLFSRQVGCEILMKLRGVEVSKSIRCLVDRSGLAEVTWEALSVISLVFSGIRHVGRDVHQSGNRWMRSGFGNYRSPITVTDKNARSILLSKDAPGSGDIVLEGRLRLLNDADVVPVLDENVVNAFPARTIRPGAVNENNILNGILLVLRGEPTAG